MTEQRSEPGLIHYFCTAGNGMEPFLIDEVKKKLAAENVGILLRAQFAPDNYQHWCYFINLVGYYQQPRSVFLLFYKELCCYLSGLCLLKNTGNT